VFALVLLTDALHINNLSSFSRRDS